MGYRIIEIELPDEVQSGVPFEGVIKYTADEATELRARARISSSFDVDPRCSPLPPALEAGEQSVELTVTQKDAETWCQIEFELEGDTRTRSVEVKR